MIVGRMLAGAFVRMAISAQYEVTGLKLPELVSAVGAYAVITIGLAIVLFWRCSIRK